MKVYICDRCGNHYTKWQHRHTIDIFDLLCICPHDSDILDLCPDCRISLINWINTGDATNGRKFGYKPVEDINFNKNHVAKEVKEDDEC